MKRPKRMICACCGAGCLGRQWWNRDTGYGLCKKCIPFILERESEEDLARSYGVRGVHFDITEDVPEVADIEGYGTGIDCDGRRLV